MKISTTKQPIAELPATYTRITFNEKSVPTLLLEQGIQSLTVERKKEINVDARAFRSMIRAAIRGAKSFKIERIALSIDDLLLAPLIESYSRAQVLEMAVENAIIAEYEFDRYKKNKPARIVELRLCGVMQGEERAIKKAEIIGAYVNHARDLSNTPGGDMTPAVLASAAKALVKGTSVSCTILNKKAIEKEKMGAILGVSRGSVEEPRFIVLEYWGAGKPKKGKLGSSRGKSSDKDNPVVFIGKGITFDTGGLNLKPSSAVLDMHMDMSGGAAVIAAVTAAAALGLKKNIIGLIPAAENMVSGESYRPGDVLVTMSGTTVDVLNTDAEGRLVLADALTYAQRYQPRLVIDVATLTGASLVALGTHASAIMTKDKDLQNTLQELGEKSGDYVWPLPLWNEYKQYTKGVFGDIANIPAQGAQYGGCINGGMFLAHFAKDYLWAHIDMAPRMTAAPGDHLAKGSTGEPTRLLLSIAAHY